MREFVASAKLKVVGILIDIMAWGTRTVYGNPIVAMGYHTAALHDSRTHVLDGYGGKDGFDDAHILELNAATDNKL